MGQSGIATGVVVAAIGVWLVMRTITHDDQGQNLVDKLFGLDAQAPAPPATAPTPGAVAGRLAPHVTPAQVRRAGGVVSGRGMGR